MLLGDGGVGKTCLTLQFCQGVYVADYDPTIENMYNKQIGMDGGACMLEILDTAGQEEYMVMRDQYIRPGEGFLLVYSIDNRSSFESIGETRDSVIRVKEDELVPIVLVATKADLPDEIRKTTTNEGQELAKLYDCPFVETSAKLRSKVESAFFAIVQQIRTVEERKRAAAEVAQRNRKSNSSGAKCTLL